MGKITDYPTAFTSFMWFENCIPSHIPLAFVSCSVLLCRTTIFRYFMCCVCFFSCCCCCVLCSSCRFASIHSTYALSLVLLLLLLPGLSFSTYFQCAAAVVVIFHSSFSLVFAFSCFPLASTRVSSCIHAIPFRIYIQFEYCAMCQNDSRVLLCSVLCSCTDVELYASRRHYTKVEWVCVCVYACVCFVLCTHKCTLMYLC